ncbi:hypothetical protein QEN19_001744 [Hanseniaspora menglaensis]
MINPFRLPVWFVKKTYAESLHNRYNLFTLVVNFAINFFPVFVWLFLFKESKHIPSAIRPKINGQWLFYSDIFFLGGDFWNEQTNKVITAMSFFVSWGMIFGVFLLLVPYFLFHRSWGNAENSSFKIYSFLKPYHLLALFYFSLNILHIFTKQEAENFKAYKDLITWVSYVLLHLIAPIVTAVFLYIYKPPGTMGAFALSLGIQNIAGFLTHVTLPSAPPWFTHFYGMHMSEELASNLNYDTLGYSAGLTRMPFQQGTNISATCFRKSPIVFGALPSLHGAMALQCGLWFFYKYGANMRYNCKPEKQDEFFMLNDLSESDLLQDDLDLNQDSTSTLVISNGIEEESSAVMASDERSRWWWHTGRLIISFYMLLQWFSTMYLDHHYRIDLFVGGIYAITSFHIVRIFVMEKNYTEYLNIVESKETENIKKIDLSSKVWWFNEYGVLARYKLKQIEPTGDREDMSIGQRVFGKYEFHKIFKI